MNPETQIDNFLSSYGEEVFASALKLRNVVMKNLPDVIEQIDQPAKMIAYCYGQKYSQLICMIIPSKKGLKLGFNRGVELPDPESILEGAGKISRYVEIKSDSQIKSAAIKKLLKEAYSLYLEKMKK